MPELLHETQVLVAYQGDIGAASAYLKVAPTTLATKVLSDPNWYEYLLGSMAIGAMELFVATKDHLLGEMDKMSVRDALAINNSMRDFMLGLRQAPAGEAGPLRSAVNIQVNYSDANGSASKAD